VGSSAERKRERLQRRIRQQKGMHGKSERSLWYTVYVRAYALELWVSETPIEAAHGKWRLLAS